MNNTHNRPPLERRTTDEPMQIQVENTGSRTTRTYRSIMPAPIQSLADWHSNPEAFHRLTPAWMPANLIDGSTDTRPGSRATLKVPVVGPLGFTWKLEHEALAAGTGFADVQISGPFRSWRHEHRFESQGEKNSVLEDQITYEAPFNTIVGNIVGRRLDALFAFRHERTRNDLNVHLTTGLEQPLKIVVSGATGLVGSNLVAFLRSGGHEVRTLVRHEPKDANEIFWSPSDAKIDSAKLEDVDAVVHLAGASIASGRWTDARKTAIRDSRVEGTSLLATALAQLGTPPKVFVSTSAVGYYGSQGDTPLTEQSEPGEGFLANVVKEWEASADPARQAGIRVVHPRFGVVMAGEGGMLPLLAKVFRAGVGGQLGNGKQYFAWIDIDDLVGVLLESIVNPNLEGPVNAVASQQVTNAEFTKAMGRVLHRPAIFRVPATAMKLVAGELADDLILASQRVVPERLSEIGFNFAYPTLEQSLRHELG